MEASLSCHWDSYPGCAMPLHDIRMGKAVDLSLTPPLMSWVALAAFSLSLTFLLNFEAGHCG